MEKVFENVVYCSTHNNNKMLEHYIIKYLDKNDIKNIDLKLWKK